MQHQRYVLLIFVALAVLTGMTFEAASSSLFERLGIADTRWFGFLQTTAALSVVAGIGAFVALIRNVKAIAYTDEVVDELHKVTWPTRDETVRNATTVVFTTLFVAALIGLYDLLWKNVADVFLFS